MSKPFVAILMGSDSDLPVMEASFEILAKDGPNETTATIGLTLEDTLDGPIVIGTINHPHKRKLEKLNVAELKLLVKTDLTSWTLEAQIHGPSDHESVRLFNGVGHAHKIAKTDQMQQM